MICVHKMYEVRLRVPDRWCRLNPMSLYIKNRYVETKWFGEDISFTVDEMNLLISLGEIREL